MSTTSNEAATDVPLALGWRPDTDRLREEAKAYRRTGQLDRYTIIEAECWLDLVKAEIAAHRARKKTAEARAGLEELRYWRSNLRHTLRTLKSVETT